MDKKPKKKPQRKGKDKAISLGSRVSPQETKEILLGNKGAHFAEKPSIYSVEDEFAKTKKNTNFLGLIILFSFCLLLIGFSFFIIDFFEKRQEKIELTIEEFSTIDIEKVLKEANGFKNRLFKSRASLEELQEEKKFELEQASLIYDGRLSALANNNSFSEEVKRSRRRDFLNDLRAAEVSINAKYDASIDGLSEEIAKLSSKVNELDQKALDQAIINNDILDYQKKLVDSRIENIEQEYRKNIARLTTSYENKIQQIIDSFNPQRVSLKVERVATSLF